MKWLRNLLHKRLTLSEVAAWLDEQRTEHQARIQHANERIRDAFPEHITAIKKAVVELERAELKNTNIPERAKHAIQGNKERLHTITKHLCDNLTPPENAADISELRTQLRHFIKQSGRPTAILGQFFNDNIKDLRSALANLERALNDTQEAYDAEDELNELTALLKNITAVRKQQQDAKQQLHDLHEQLDTLKKKQETLRTEKEQLTNSKDYLAIKDDILNAATERQKASQAISDLFNPLTTPLKKYAHHQQNEKLASYAENPVPALVNDYSLTILKHVDPLIAALTKNELGIDDAQTTAALQTLKALNKEDLSGMIHRYANAKKRESDLHHTIAQRPIMRQYEQYAEQLKTVSAQIENTEKQINALALPTDDELRAELAQHLRKHRIKLN